MVMVMMIGSAEATMPAVFVLGDSTVDVGTNNFLTGSVDRADFPHNGIDFPGSKATGRFSNGHNIADFLGLWLPFPLFSFWFIVHPAKCNSSFKGVNFASGGSGILDTTGDGVKTVVPLSEQVQQLSTISSRLASFKGAETAAEYLATSVFIISIGSNDMFHYYHDNSSSSSKEQFISQLTATYQQHLKTMLGFGVRKIGIIAAGPVGCCPAQRRFNQTSGCLEPLNDLAVSFNAKVKTMMVQAQLGIRWDAILHWGYLLDDHEFDQETCIIWIQDHQYSMLWTWEAECGFLLHS
ncbi:unnamed protein product [Linum tenue]|uniref:GDSL esterase/lipase n=1 Tax=Linum tenue TaxID=586396 RepID=A0AAV0PEH2_9ROSI|nr:unnamed protein product [Linum tenue]